MLLRRRLHVRGVQRQAGERQAADQVAQHGRDLVPQEVIEPRELRAQQQAGGEEEHVHDRVLEHHVEEQHDGHPHGEHLARHAGGDHRAHHAGGDHPVAEHAADEQRQHARQAELLVAERAAHADGADRLADRVRLGGEAVGDVDGHEHRDGEGAGEVAAEDEPPVSQHSLERDARALVDQRERAEHEDAREQVEAEQVEQAEAHREEDRAGEGLPGAHVDRDGEPGGQGKDGAGHVGADQRIARRHEDLRLAGVDHLRGELRGGQIGHFASSR
jgi:hypothetical protein